MVRAFDRPEGYEVEVYDDLVYAAHALASGRAGVDRAMKLAANRIAGLGLERGQTCGMWQKSASGVVKGCEDESARAVVAVAVRPRACLMGDLVLREPTIGHEMWVERVSTYIDMTVNRNFKIVYAYALSRDWTVLPDAVKAKAVVEKVFTFARRNLFKY